MIDDFRPMKRPAKPAPTFETQTPHAQEPTVPFQTPDQISQRDSAATTQITTPRQQLSQPIRSTPPRGTGHHWFNLPWPPNRQEIILTILVFIMAAFGVTGFVLLHKKPTTPVAAAKPVAKAAVAPKPTTVPSTLSGLPVSADVNQRPVIGAMIENSTDARPQSGLSQAGVVFEAVAEGGVTRFLALFQDQQPTSIGPVRSARPYYVQWLMGFKAAYAHVGGSPDALADIKSWGVQNMDQFANAGVYHRVSSRPSPHNVYSNVVDLANLASQKGFKSDFTGFARKTASPSKTPSATTINFSLSSRAYNVQYGYDAASNTYLRSEGGAPQTDANTGKQLAPNVVVAMVVPLSAGTKDAQGSNYSDYNTIGNGTAYVFQDGGVTVGNWTKTANDSQITFTDGSGKTISLNPGQTWITAVTSNAKVLYK